MNDTRGSRARAARPGRPSTAPDTTWLRIAELARSGLFDAEIADQLNRERIRTLSGEGRWNGNRVRHARRTPKYETAREADLLEALGRTPITLSDYMKFSQPYIRGAAADRLVFVPIGFRPLGPEASDLVRRRLLAGKTAVLSGRPSLFQIMAAPRPTWQHYADFKAALQDANIALEGEFVQVNGINLASWLPEYGRRLADVTASKTPRLLPVRLLGLAS